MRKPIRVAFICLILFSMMLSVAAAPAMASRIEDFTISRDLSNSRRIQCAFDVSVDSFAQDGIYHIYIYDVTGSTRIQVGYANGLLSNGILSGDGTYWIVECSVPITVSTSGDHPLVAELEVIVGGGTMRATSSIISYWSP